MIENIHVCVAETLENGHSINELISHGIDLLTALLPQSSPVEEVRYICIYMYIHVCVYMYLYMLKPSNDWKASWTFQTSLTASLL